MEHFGDNVVSFFKKAVTKIEELQVQGALGKAELVDKFEEIKRETRGQYQNIKSQINSTIDKDREKWHHLKTKIDELDEMLQSDKVEKHEILEEQKKKLKTAFLDVKDLILKD